MEWHLLLLLMGSQMFHGISIPINYPYFFWRVLSGDISYEALGGSADPVEAASANLDILRLMPRRQDGLRPT